MEHWSARDERPWVRPEESSSSWWVPAIAIALVVGIGMGAVWHFGGLPGWSVSEAPPPPQALAEPAPAPAPAPPPQPEAREPIPEPAPQAPEKPLPTLEKSDAMARDSISGLVGRRAFSELLLPEHLVRRIVATVDNLPRETAPRRTMPFKAVPGRFAVEGKGEDAFTLDDANFKRYAPYVRVLATLDAKALVSTYVRAYPLFQKAYRELGYPAGNFNHRLVEAIDDMLAAPEVAAPVKLMRPKVLYEFADPDLETRSAGQKMMIRMGGANAASVKQKLREIRRELLAASQERKAPQQ
jgi:hypothetical protein